MPDQPVALRRWHAVVESRDPALLDDLLADEVVFRSPAVFASQGGKAVTIPSAFTGITAQAAGPGWPPRCRPARPGGRCSVGRVTDSAAGRAAVLAPGARYSTERPLLMYPGLAVERRGGYAHHLSWSLPELASDDDEREWVIAQVTAAIDATAAATGAAPVVIGKSLASLSAPVVAERGLTAVWLTPVLTDEPTATALRAATGPSLLVGGTADPVWDGRAARMITPHVLEVAGADHGMLVPGPLSGSAGVLGQVITAVEDFLDRVAWPR